MSKAQVGSNASRNSPVAAFDVFGGSATLWTPNPANQAVRPRWRTQAQPTWRNGPLLQPSLLSAGKSSVRIDGLPANTVIEYQWVDRSDAPVSETGRFRTPPETKSRIKFVFTGDMDEAFQPFRLFDAMAAKRPDFCLLLGDTIYADLPKATFVPIPSHYRQKYENNRNDVHLRRFLAQHSTFAIWDDHEIQNNTGADHPALAAAQSVYREFWPCASVTQTALYRSFNWGGVKFIVLDLRSHRQLADASGRKTMLGEAQKRWLLRELLASTAPFTFIASSVPFQGGGSDTWAGFKEERGEVESIVSSVQNTKCIFLSADYHLARDWTNPAKRYFDFMAGPIGSFTKYGKEPQARERYAATGRFQYGDGFNFGLVEVDATLGTGRISWVDPEGKTLGSVDFAA
jgi:phosphodiesterase/alkaline phosphatase D-like protein